MASELCSNISRSVLTTHICSVTAPLPPARRAPALSTSSLPHQHLFLFSLWVSCPSWVRPRDPAPWQGDLESQRLNSSSDTRHCVRANNPPPLCLGLWLVGGLLHICLPKDSSTLPPKCKFSFGNAGYKVNQHCRAVLLSATVLFRLISDNKAAKLEAARLFLESASSGAKR